MKKIFLYSFIFVFIIKVNAQVNLVPNPSFETFTTCPNMASQISYATPWQGVTTNSTDYFNVCAIAASNVSIPDGGGGFQYARTGVAYAGMWVINSFGGNYREYLQVQLDSTLELDSCYYVEFYCNLHNQGCIGINAMGAFVSNTAVSAVGPGLVLQYTPQIVSDTFLTDTLNWMRVSGYYQALGGEQYITIGNFSIDDPADTIHTCVFGADSYYYIDDITVKKVVACDTFGVGIEENQSITTFKLFPNPSNGMISLQYLLNADDKAEMRIYDLAGRFIDSHLLNSSVNQLIINEDHLNNGIYFYQIIIDDKVVKSDKFVIIKE